MDNKKINKVINYNGNFKQSVICMEECAELTKAISKMLRGKDGYYTNLVEEMADVLISIEMLKQIYHVDESDLEGWVNFKVNRNYEKVLAETDNRRCCVTTLAVWNNSGISVNHYRHTTIRCA